VTALVTGGAGFLGSHLCDHLLAQGKRVICLDNLARGSTENLHGGDLTFVRHDVSVPIPDDFGFVDEVYHLACPVSPDYCQRNPLATFHVAIEGTRNALQFAFAKGARFLLASSSEIYGDPIEHPQKESYNGNLNPVGPRSPYAEGKRAAETLTTIYRREGLNAGIFRLFNVYGPRMRLDDGRVVPTFIRQALAGEPLTIFGGGNQTRSLCYVDDIVRGIGLLGEKDCRVHGPINLGSQREISTLELALLVLEATGSPSELHFVRPGAAYVEEPRRRCPDITRAFVSVGWTPRVELEDGLRRTIASYAELSAA
jgi:nucleoside-diphosphate-sugar epimerase